MLDSIFEPAELIDAAREAADLDDLWGDSYREGLAVLTRAIVGEAGLYPARAWRIARWMIELLATRARIAARLRRYGDAITGVPIERPIFITGLPRTGTTMLHNVMAGMSGLRGYTPWEMRSVVPEDDDDPDWRAGARDDTAAELAALHDRTPELARIHPMTADTPDECHWLTRHSFASLVFGYTLHVPSYVRWLLARPQPRVYAEHRVQLQLLAHREPGHAGGRLVLKDPGHLWHLGELLDTYPDALVVRLHRDPVEAVPSLCSLMHALQRMDSDRVDPRELGPFALELVALGLDRERELRASRGAERILDVEFRDLMDDPVATVRAICERAGQPFDDDARARLTTWLRDNPRHKAGRHVYTAAAFGLDEHALRERLGERG